MWRSRGLQNVPLRPNRLGMAGDVAAVGAAKNTALHRQPFLSLGRQGQAVDAWIGMGFAHRRGCPQSLGDIRRACRVRVVGTHTYLREVLAPGWPAKS